MITGLLTQKPGRDPVVGEVKNFIVLQMPAVGGKNAWTKIKNASQTDPGAPHKIVSVTPTGRTDAHGNVSFNINLEPAEGQQPTTAPRSVPFKQSLSKDDYWMQRDQRDREWRAEQTAQQPKIMRQHSQEMALRYLEATGKGNEVTNEKLVELINWFQRDIERSPEKAKPAAPSHPTSDPTAREDEF